MRKGCNTKVVCLIVQREFEELKAVILVCSLGVDR
jgi:hypothetical protein